MDDNLVLLSINGKGNVLPNEIAATVIVYSAAVIAVGLRLWARRLSKARLWADDWLILLALFFDTLSVGIIIAWWCFGGGRYIGDVTAAKLRAVFLVIFVTEFVYSINMLFVRLSILALWQRLFPQKWPRWYCRFWMVINLLWTISTIIVACLQCQPIWGFWDRFRSGSECKVDVKKHFLWFAVSSIIIDVAVLALPLVRCWKLNLSRTNKLLVTGIFATGLFTTIISGVRVKAVVQANLQSLDAINATWTFSDTGAWSLIEVNIATVCACLPVLRPVLAKLVPVALVPRALQRKTFVPYSVRQSLARRADRRRRRQQQGRDAKIGSTTSDTVVASAARDEPAFADFHSPKEKKVYTTMWTNFDSHTSTTEIRDAVSLAENGGVYVGHPGLAL